MEKRQPLSVMIALQSKKMKGDGGAPPGERSDDSQDDDDAEEEASGKYDDPGLISACEDAIDAFKNRDAKALSAAWGHYLDIRESAGEPDGDERD